MNDNEQMEFFYEIFDASLPRLGPGDDHSTMQALDVLLSTRPKLTDEPDPVRLRVLDIDTNVATIINCGYALIRYPIDIFK